MKRKLSNRTAKTDSSKIKNSKKRKNLTKLEAKPLTEDQIKFFVEFYNKNKSFPGSKIPCNITGKLTTCVGPWMIKKIKEYGSAEQLLRQYRCRGALKTQKQLTKPVSKKKKRKQLLDAYKDEQKNWNIPKIAFTPPQKLSQADVEQTTKNTCFRPDIYLNNDRHCDGCSFFNFCSNPMKCLLTKKSLKNKKIA